MSTLSASSWPIREPANKTSHVSCIFYHLSRLVRNTATYCYVLTIIPIGFKINYNLNCSYLLNVVNTSMHLCNWLYVNLPSLYILNYLLRYDFNLNNKITVTYIHNTQHLKKNTYFESNKSWTYLCKKA